MNEVMASHQPPFVCLIISIMSHSYRFDKFKGQKPRNICLFYAKSLFLILFSFIRFILTSFHPKKKHGYYIFLIYI